MQHRHKRILWLLNHKTLMPYETQLLQELGFEVFVPKIIPLDASFRSGIVDFSCDRSLTIPSVALNKLNAFDFYNKKWSTDIVAIVNRYFGVVFSMPHSIQFQEVIEKFEGQILLRAFGLDNFNTYKTVLEALYGRDIFDKIFALKHRFWFAQGYPELAEVEPPLIAERALFLPIGAPDLFWKTKNTYTGKNKRILFLCPNCVTNPYYATVYKKFKKEFGDLPHSIIGTQDTSIDDSNVLGFVSEEELIKLYQDCAVFYYSSTELRHLHYSPIEAAINGMPVVYYANSLLGKMTTEVALGRCHSYLEARSCVERILDDDKDYIDELRADQHVIPYKFSTEYCTALWKKNYYQSDFKKALEKERQSYFLWREIKRTLLRPFAKGRAQYISKKSLLAPLSLLRVNGLNNVDNRIEDGIDFSKADFPSFLQNINGISYAEPWGRWSDGSLISIKFTNSLPLKFKLIIEGGAYGPNLGARIKVRIGNSKQFFTFSVGPDMKCKIILNYFLKKTANLIEITVPKPVKPQGGNRQIGIGLVSLKIHSIEA